jgi:hypothetical protein
VRLATPRWWCLTRVARACGLKVCILARRDLTDPLPKFVAFTQDDATTLEAIAVIQHVPLGQHAHLDGRFHTEWTH